MTSVSAEGRKLGGPAGMFESRAGSLYSGAINFSTSLVIKKTRSGADGHLTRRSFFSATSR